MEKNNKKKRNKKLPFKIQKIFLIHNCMFIEFCLEFTVILCIIGGVDNHESYYVSL